MHTLTTTFQRKRKSQMEIMGIAVIMVLFSIGMLIFLSVSMRPKANLKQTLDLTEYATNFISVLRHTTTTCNGATVEALLKDIASYDESINCEGFGVGSSGVFTQGQTSLDFLNSPTGPIATTLEDGFHRAYPERKYVLAYCTWDTMKSGCACSSWNTRAKACMNVNDPQIELLRFASIDSSGTTDDCPLYSLKSQPIPTDRGTMNLALWICEPR